jgi:hypothetical protein
MNNKIKISLLSTALLTPFFAWMYFQREANPTKRPIAISQSISAPVATADIPMDNYFFDADSLKQIVRPTGTRIIVQPGTFKRKDGTDVHGPVELKVREFHSAHDILRAGIPMAVNTEKGEYLQSAGMIEMRAYEKGEALEVNQGKGIGVDLAGFKPSDGYQLYYLKNDNQWVTEDSFKRNGNAGKIEIQEKIQKYPNKEAFADSLEAIGTYFSIAGNAFYSPQLEALATRRWKLLNDRKHPDIEKAMRVDWDAVQLEVKDKRRQIYELTFSKTQYSMDMDKDVFKSITIQASPVFDAEGEESDRAFFEAQMKEYERVLAKLKEEEERLKDQADLLNSFVANNLGVYNIDRLYRCDDLYTIPVSFDFENTVDRKFNNISLYAVYEDDNSVIKYDQRDWKSVSFSANKKMRLIVVLPDKMVAVVENQEIQKAIAKKEKEIFFVTRRYPADEYIRAGKGDLAMK